MSEVLVNGDLDVVTVFSLLHTHGHVTPMLDAALGERRTTTTEFNALLMLPAARSSGLHMGEIGKRLVGTRTNVTGVVDGLERRRLAARCHQADRRATLPGRTDRVRMVLKGPLAHYSPLAAQRTAGLAKREMRAPARLLANLRGELRRQRRGKTGRPPCAENPLG